MNPYAAVMPAQGSNEIKQWRCRLPGERGARGQRRHETENTIADQCGDRDHGRPDQHLAPDHRRVPVQGFLETRHADKHKPRKHQQAGITGSRAQGCEQYTGTRVNFLQGLEFRPDQFQHGSPPAWRRHAGAVPGNGRGDRGVRHANSVADSRNRSGIPVTLCAYFA